MIVDCGFNFPFILESLWSVENSREVCREVKNRYVIRKRKGDTFDSKRCKNKLEIPDKKIIQKCEIEVSESTQTDNSSNMIQNLNSSIEPVYELPFSIPKLSKKQRAFLNTGEIVESLTHNRRIVSGHVCCDVKASVNDVWEYLLNLQSYPSIMPYVKRVGIKLNSLQLKQGVAGDSRAIYIVSKYKIKVHIDHKYKPHPQGDYMICTLDPSSTKLAMKKARGIWYTQVNPDEKGKDYTRIWMIFNVEGAPLLPGWIMENITQKFMPKALRRMKPNLERVATKRANLR